MGRAHPLSCIQTNLLKDWFRQFIPEFYPTKDSPVFLVINGHYSNIRNPYLMYIGSSYHIIHLPTPKLQPLDEIVMNHLKSLYIEERRQGLGCWWGPLTSRDFIKFFGKAYQEVKIGEIVVNGYKFTWFYLLIRGTFKSVTTTSIPSTSTTINSIASTLVSSSAAPTNEILPVPST